MKWIVVGWYSPDPSNADIKPYARTVEVEALTKTGALDYGEKELAKTKLGDELLNWYARRKDPNPDSI